MLPAARQDAAIDSPPGGRTANNRRRRPPGWKMKEQYAAATVSRTGIPKRWLAWATFAWLLAVGVWHTHKEMPAGTDVRTASVEVAAQDARFLHDLTYTGRDGSRQHEQQIFDEVLRIIDEAESFIIADFFLLNDRMGAMGDAYRHLGRELVSHLLARKAARPGISILLITDPINEVYGGAPLPMFETLRRAGIDVVATDLRPLRDSNPSYSALWRVFGQWWENSATGGQLPNPFARESGDITLRSWLALLNFKANHRKLIIADDRDGRLTALVASANPHDASSEHSNVAVRFSSPLAGHIAASEMEVARFSGWKGSIPIAAPAQSPIAATDPLRLSFLTEGAIQDHLLHAIDTTTHGDSIRIAVFYLSDRKVIKALIAAAARGVDTRLILDPNRDAFGMRKDGVPNRPVANELVERSGERIAVRWYRTDGEQFHSKMVLITQADRLIASLGSANLTRRNLGNYNLEANLVVETDATTTIGRTMVHYFERLWNNDGPPGTEFTVAFDVWQDAGRIRYWRYRLMEATGLSTF